MILVRRSTNLLRDHFGNIHHERYLLVGRQNTSIDIKQVRSQLKKLVGSSKSWSAEREAAVMQLATANSQSELSPRRMIDSYREATIPIGQNEKLREKYVNFHNAVRFGRILEDLDSMAVWISYTHNADPESGEKQQKSPLSIVTATVDRIKVQVPEILPDQDISFRGHVTWVGSSSMEVTMDVEQEQNGVLQQLVEAKFLMVARDPKNKVKAFVHPLSVVGPEEEHLYSEGNASKVMRAQQAKDSLLRSAPDEEERLIIHDLFMSTLDEKAATFRRPQKAEGSVWMEDSTLKNIIICFPEKRNLYNKIFGGFLMRKGFELGWICACMYSKQRPFLVAVDDILFRKPVEIGSLLYLSTQVDYTYGNHLQVRVHAEVVDTATGKHDTSNVFHFTFRTDQDVPPVVPKSYAEYMIYIDGKRHFEINNK